MTANAAAFTILYDGWLLAQNRVTTQVFNHVMDKYDERWAKSEDRQKVVAAAHHTGRNARTQDVVMCHAAAMTLLWWLFRSGEYKGTHKSWHAERDLVVTFNHRHGKVKIDLWASDRSLVEIETDIMNGQQIRPVDESKIQYLSDRPARGCRRAVVVRAR
jgi:hypothetical protein